MRSHILIIAALFLSGCSDAYEEYKPLLTGPEQWHNADGKVLALAETKDLKNWWTKFNDPAMTQLVELALEASPDREVAEGRVLEARGLRKTAVSSLLPEIGASASGGRRDNGSTEGNYYDAGFDASYEVDIFGGNRNTASAADEAVQSLEAEYEDVTLTLIGDIARTYIDLRGYQKQAAIARKNLDLQEKTLVLVKQLFEAGESPRLDVERSENIVNTTRASIPEFERLAETSLLSLSVLTGRTAEDLRPVVAQPASVPGAQVGPVLMSPAAVLAQRPDVRAAMHTLAQRTDLTDAAIADIFPTFTLEGFYGVTKTALLGPTNVWNVAAGAAVSLLNFGRIEGQIDAAKGREKQAFGAFRKTILVAVTDVEGALNDYAKHNQRRVSLDKAYENAQSAFSLSEALYKEGEISFLDVLDAQRTVNESEASLTSAEVSQAQALVRLYKSLGVGL